MKLGVSQSHVQSDDAVNVHPSGARDVHHGCRVEKTVFSLGRGRCGGDCRQLQRPAVKIGQVGGAVAGSWRLWRGPGMEGRGRAGGVFLEVFFGPCGHAATSSSSALF